MNPLTIAIDGPSGAGKSTIAKAVAKELGLLYLDTGAMYRTCGLLCARENLNIKDTEKIIALVNSAKIDIRFTAGNQHVYLNDEDVTDLLRTGEIARWASDVSAIPQVRLRMVAIQREIAATRPLIMDGRDIGTYVLPEAECKIFLTAGPEVRAQRRLAELQEKNPNQYKLEDVLQDMKYRDEQDSNRAFAPLRQAEDAVLLDTSDLSIEEAVQAVIQIVKSKVSQL